MSSRRSWPAVTVLLALVSASLVASPTWISAAAQESSGATITLHLRLCPSHFAGPDYYGECHDNAAANMEFFLEGPESRREATDEAGNLTFAGLSAGTYTILVGVPGEFIEDIVIFCAETSDLGTAIAESHTLTVANGDDIVCDWYVVQANLSGLDEGDDTEGDVTALPNTGSGGGQALGRPDRDLPVVGLVLICLAGAITFWRRRFSAA